MVVICVSEEQNACLVVHLKYDAHLNILQTQLDFILHMFDFVTQIITPLLATITTDNNIAQFTDLSLLSHAFTSIFDALLFYSILVKIYLSTSQSFISFIFSLFSTSKVSFFTIKSAKFDLTLSQSESPTHWKKSHPPDSSNLLHLTYLQIEFFTSCQL